MTQYDCIIVGGGLCGIMAAKTLVSQGKLNVLIIEKSKSVGGRLATRRIEAGKADHGAQYFTAFTDLFQLQAQSLQNEGMIKKWFGGTHPRFFAVDGMNSLAKHLAKNIKVAVDTKVVTIQKETDCYLVVTNEGEFRAKAIIVTAPAPQALQLIDRSLLNETACEKLASIQFVPCLVGMLELDGKSQLDRLGYADSKLPEGIERIVDHLKKGISQNPILSVYMNASWSEKYFESEPDEILATMIELIPKKLLGEATIISAQLKKWRYAEAIKVVQEPYVIASSQPHLLFAGDAFISLTDRSKRARIESAALSGILVGQEMVNLLDKEG